MTYWKGTCGAPNVRDIGPDHKPIETPSETLARVWKEYGLSTRKPPDPMLMACRELRAAISRLLQDNDQLGREVRRFQELAAQAYHERVSTPIPLMKLDLILRDDDYKPDLNNAQIG